MRKKLVGILILILPLTGFAQEEAVTASGKTVLLFPDSTWKLKPQPQLQDTDTTRTDTLAIPKPEKHKVYSDTSTGFKGFLKPEFKVPTLPDRSHGVYEFRVKVNKEGFVREITTTLRGPNGEAEKVLRAAITKLKYRPDG